MLQPLPVFDKDAYMMIGVHGYNFLVAQTYFRMLDAEKNTVKVPLVVTPYFKRDEADFHKRKIQNDNYACVITLSSLAHRHKISELMLSTSMFQLYKGELQHDAKKPNWATRYTKAGIISWISRNEGLYVNPYDTVITHLSIEYGVIQVNAHINGRFFKMPLEEVENYRDATSSGL